MTEKPLPLSLRGLPHSTDASRAGALWQPIAHPRAPPAAEVAAAAGLAEAARGADEEGWCLGETHLLAG